MSFISFSNAVTLPLRAVAGPAQALVPWMARIRQSLERLAFHSDKENLDTAAGGTLALHASTLASNDSVFGACLDMPEPAPVNARAAPCSASLRVVREADSAIASDCAGRMVISGRMADVCAELDRMAQRAGVQGQ